MKNLYIYFLVLSFGINIIMATLLIKKASYPEVLKMANTVDPIISMISRQLGDYNNIQSGAASAIGGKLIYKRERSESCIGNIKNQYYIRLYKWNWENNKLWYLPLKDIKLDAYSCIEEENLLIPYWDEKLQNAELGKKYYK